MTNIRLFVFVIIAAVWYVTPIGTAAIVSENPIGKLERMLLGLSRKDLMLLRSALIEEGGPSPPCYNDPCGYTVYMPTTRKLLYFFSRPCYCPETYKCVRTDWDSLGENAYIHRCRLNDNPDPKSELPPWLPRY